jgi:hypothetical protein
MNFEKGECTYVPVRWWHCCEGSEQQLKFELLVELNRCYFSNMQKNPPNYLSFSIN